MAQTQVHCFTAPGAGISKSVQGFDEVHSGNEGLGKLYVSRVFKPESARQTLRDESHHLMTYDSPCMLGLVPDLQNHRRTTVTVADWQDPGGGA